MTSFSNTHVLVVDDNEQMRLLLRCLMRAGGIVHISEAETAAQALEVMRAARVDLTILDWEAAPVDGLAFARMLRSDASSPNPFMPLLMLTAHTEASRVAAARDAGVTGILKKPIDARLLFARVASALRDKRQFVRSADFHGPDRRRHEPNRVSPFRRARDQGGDAIDRVRWRA